MRICVDLDNTICITDENLPLSIRYERVIVKDHMVKIINDWYKKHTIIIDTARGSSLTGLTKYYKLWKLKVLTQNQLKSWGVQYHNLRVGQKTYADLYIDDKGIHPNVFCK
tara:strand:- start:520 stop:852 length:333 start_codon:yes stop_codon:yes gene_type:complete